jgi:hypothetical protein
MARMTIDLDFDPDDSYYDNRHYHGASPDPCYDTGGSCADPPKTREWDDATKAKHYWYFRERLINPPLTPWSAGQGIDPIDLHNMLACVTLTHPDLGEGGDLAERNKGEDLAASRRLATARGDNTLYESGPAPAVRNSGRALHVTAVFMYIGMLVSLVVTIGAGMHHNGAVTLIWGFDAVAAGIAGRVYEAKARKRKGH